MKRNKYYNVTFSYGYKDKKGRFLNMKKLVVLGLAAVMALGAPFSVCAAEEETTVEHPSGLKIGCAVQTMSNQVWAQQM